MTGVPPRLLDAAGLLARLGLAAVWLVSGVIKALDAGQTYLAVQAYDVLPAGLVSPAAAALPWLEIGLGLLLMIGLGTRLVAALSALLLLIYIAGVSQAWARGLTIDCGCFGGGGQVSADRTAYGLEIVRDTGFLLLAGWLLVRARSAWSVERTVGRGELVTVGADDEREER